MLEKDPSKRSTVKELLNDKKIAEGISCLSELIDKYTFMSIMDQGLFGSKCASQIEIIPLFEHLKEKHVYEANLEYRASEHGWKCSDFHQKADNKGWTVTLFKILDGDCIGGFTTQSWDWMNRNFEEIRDN